MTDLFQIPAKRGNRVECFGLSFDSDAERLAYFRKLLSEKLKDPSFRNLDGFPICTDEIILSLSDPPYYTACPNPFIPEFVTRNGTLYSSGETYQKEPFTADVSEGKSDAIYTAHSYHTKVPHKAIMRYLLHYTMPGDVIFDGFCGTGMTGVAAQLCEDPSVVASLGYKVDADGAIWAAEVVDGRNEWRLFSKLGARNAVIGDLSPAATFIAA